MEQNIFSEYINKQTLFLDKSALTAAFIPDKISHRDDEIRQLSSILAPMLRGYKPNNIFVYGTCGTGKTICIKYVMKHLAQAAKAVKIVYVNCKMKRVADTEYRLFARLLKEMGIMVPDTGLPTDVLYRRFFDVVDEQKTHMILILDEIDTIVKKIGDEFLYNLTRSAGELTNSSISLVGITNDTSFMENLDMRVKSSLSQEEVIFRPYNAVQLSSILTERIKFGFRPGIVDDSVIRKCAAIAAQEHGDARRALDLLRVAGELAERTGETTIKEKQVDAAQQKLDVDKISETVRSQPFHSQTVLYSIISLSEKSESNQWKDARILTGDVYVAYAQICISNNTSPLTQRRVSDLIGELDMLGIINAKIVSKGRHGRTREIALSINNSTLEKVKGILLENLG